MNSRVVLQINRFGKRNSANAAFVVFLATVQFFMGPQTRVTRESTATDAARERFFIPGKAKKLIFCFEIKEKILLLLLMRLFGTPDKNNATPVTFIAFRDCSGISFLHWMRAAWQFRG